MTDIFLSEESALGAALMALDLMGFDTAAMQAMDTDSGAEAETGDEGDFGLAASLGDRVTVRLDFDAAQQIFNLAADIDAPALPDAIHVTALQVNSLLPAHQKIAYNISARTLAVRSSVRFENTEIDDLAMELSALTEVALVLSEPSDKSAADAATTGRGAIFG